jgi:hypothetical protein
MAFTVLRVSEVRRTVENELTKRERRTYDAAVEALRGEGCRAGGKRLAAADSGITQCASARFTARGGIRTAHVSADRIPGFTHLLLGEPAGVRQRGICGG